MNLTEAEPLIRSTHLAVVCFQTSGSCWLNLFLERTVRKPTALEIIIVTPIDH
jgi:hypothetical protein